jgi:hypothetical protein
MKHFLLLFLFLVFHSDSKFDYNLLSGSWRQKTFANTPDTGIFTFSSDSTATLEMRKAESDDLIASVKGQYSIDKEKNKLTITILGKPKTFSVLHLTAEVLTIKNIAENKEEQTFERYNSK